MARRYDIRPMLEHVESLPRPATLRARVPTMAAG
jgi:hypothetical protein